jgi:hypothetical protein
MSPDRTPPLAALLLACLALGLWTPPAGAAPGSGRGRGYAPPSAPPADPRPFGPSREGAAPEPRREAFPQPRREMAPEARGGRVAPERITPDKLERWRSMSPEEQDRARERYRRWKSLPPERQERILERERRWQKLPEEDRRYLRERRQLFREAPPERRQVIGGFFRHMEEMPRERRREMRNFVWQLRDLPPADRDRRLMEWPYYRGLSPGERGVLRDFLFSELAGPPGAPSGRGGEGPPSWAAPRKGREGGGERKSPPPGAYR